MAMKRYKAMIWVQGSDKAGRRVSVEAEGLKQAREELEAQYGEGNVFDLHCEEDASRPR
jgi:hypothetical protein